MRWFEPEWRADADAWIREQATVAGPIEQPHVYPWSTVMRVPTAEGILWFKAVSSQHAFEPELTLLLSEGFPDRVTRLVSVDPSRGWMLMRDAGTRLRDADVRDPLIEWAAILPRYAEIQIAFAPRAHELLGLGVPDARLAGLPRDVEALLDDDAALLLGDSEELTADQRDELRRRMPALRAVVEELASYGIPDTIQHDDLHDGQVFLDRGRRVISDWGDSSVSHPFHTLTVTLRAIAWRHGLEPGSHRLLRLRDAYLEPWGVDPFVADLAYRTGTLARALAWHHHIRARGPEHWDRDDAESVPYGLRLYLEAGPIGTWQ
ncbi:MAG TPA: phosphotransferase [Gaiellaceae bacterium]